MTLGRRLLDLGAQRLESLLDLRARGVQLRKSSASCLMPLLQVRERESRVTCLGRQIRSHLGKTSLFGLEAAELLVDCRQLSIQARKFVLGASSRRGEIGEFVTQRSDAFCSSLLGRAGGIGGVLTHPHLL